MSFVSQTFCPIFPMTIKNKLEIRRHVITCSQTSRSSSIATTPSTKAPKPNLKSPIQLINQIPKFVTKAVAVAAPPVHETISKVEKMRDEGFWLRKWEKEDLTHLAVFVVKHGLALCAPFFVTSSALWVMVILNFFTGMGVTLGYHRLLTHRSFKLPKWLEYFFAYCGNHAGQRDPIFWVSVHKTHHNHTDTLRDPHGPTEGFWFSHMGWFLYNDYLAAKAGEARSGEYSNVPELKAQPFYRFLHDTYVWHTIGLGAVLYMLGGMPWLTWGMGMRSVMVHHFTFFAASVCHRWGERPWNTADTSTNNWWVAALTFGEGWHNNHHAFPSSACHGIEWWQYDLTWELIKFLEFVGLATDVKLPSKAEEKRMLALSHSN